MKFCTTLVLIVIVGLAASGSALPAKKRLVYYQQPARYSTGPQRMMYIQYVKPAGHPFARSTQAAEVLVAGDTVATSTYLREADTAAAGPAVDVNTYERGEDVLSEAAAYPSTGLEAPVYSVPADVDIVAEENELAHHNSGSSYDADADASKTGREYDFEAGVAAEEAAGAEAEIANAEAELPAPAPLVPVAKPSRRYVPANKKKVYVELDQSVETDDDTSAAEEEEEEQVIAAAVPARRPVAKKPAKAAAASSSSKAQKPLPAGTFFPIDFGGTAGGAIAIANSFSTGEGGSATSHAIAYGSPDAVRARQRPSKKH